MNDLNVAARASNSAGLRSALCAVQVFFTYLHTCCCVCQMCRYKTYNRSTDSGVYFTLGIHRTAQFIRPPFTATSAQQPDSNVSDSSSPVNHGPPVVTSSSAVTLSQTVTSSVTSSSGAGVNSSEPRYVRAESRNGTVTDSDRTTDAVVRFIRADFLTTKPLRDFVIDYFFYIFTCLLAV